MNIKKTFCLFFITFIMLCAYSTKYIYAEDAIFSNGFEDGEGNWKTNSSSITFSVVTNPAFEGQLSGNISSTSTGSFGVEHIISGIEENTDYLINGRIKILDPRPAKAFMRIAWYESIDGSGSQIKTEDSEIVSYVTDWKILSFVVKAPSPVHSAKIRLLVSSGSAYFDNIAIQLNIPTSQVTPPSNSVFPTPSEIIPTVTTVSNIYLSEIMAYPEVGQTEWIELYNDNAVEVTLSDWYIDDIENAGSSPKKITITIPAKGYAVFDLTSSMFNNDSDKARLLDSEEREKDSISYTSSQKNYSLGKNNNTICMQVSSKNLPNNNCLDIVSPTIAGVVSPIKKPTEPTHKKTPSPTPGSKKLIPTLQPKKTIGLKPTASAVTESNSENILGATTEIPFETTSSYPLIYTLTILASSYSILSIISIITKITILKRISAT